MRDCPFDAEVWATASVLEEPGMLDYEYSKVFALDTEVQILNLDTIRERGIPIVSTQSYATEPLPYFDIRRKLGANYWRPTVSFMIAYAMYLGYKKLRLYGVDQGPEKKYAWARPILMFWLGMATGLGVEWELGPNCILLRDN